MPVYTLTFGWREKILKLLNYFELNLPSFVIIDEYGFAISGYFIVVLLF